jgi:hypothetical protein
VVTESHRSDDASELLEILLLRREQRGTLEEWDHPLEQRLTIPHNQHQRAITLAVAPDRPAAEPRLDQLEHLSPVAILADMELWYELKPDATRCVALRCTETENDPSPSTYPEM